MGGGLEFPKIVNFVAKFCNLLIDSDIVSILKFRVRDDKDFCLKMNAFKGVLPIVVRTYCFCKSLFVIKTEFYMIFARAMLHYSSADVQELRLA